MKPLSLIRPKRLTEMVGQQKLAHQIRRHARKAMPKAWLFYGQTGLGKTTIARIVALSLQCNHASFGEPCDKCWKRYASYPIFELNAGDKTGAPELREFVSGSEYITLTRHARKVYIFDEAHMISGAGQNLLLKYFEDDSNDTIWIVCSSEPHKIKRTLRRRCTVIRMQELDTDQTSEYVKQCLRRAHSELDGEQLVDALVQRQINSPGLIAQAVQKYLTGVTAEEAADIEGALEIDTKALCISVTKGDWEQVSKILQEVPHADARGLRASSVGWLRVQMLETVEFNQRNRTLMKCIQRLCYMTFADDLVIMTALAAELYGLCELFSEYKR